MPLPPSPQESPPPSQDELPAQRGATTIAAVDDDRASWPAWTAPAAVVLGLMFGAVGSIVVDVIAHVGGSSLSHPSPAANIIADIVFDLCFVGAALWLASWRGHARAIEFGYWIPPLWKAVKAFGLAALGYYGLTAVYSALLSLHGTDKLPSELGATHSTAALIAAAVFVCAIAPMAEEFFFRGFIFNGLRNMHVRIGRVDASPWIAAVLTGILFGLAHTGSASSQYLVPLGFLGFVLCIVRWKTRSLYPCMALHSANNALALGINQLHWSAVAILGLIIASWVVIAAVTGPLALRAPRAAPPSAAAQV
ncbi:MAG: CPBP family intramembrane glutamic endopeptidase [Solirubrobacteraceae bacterium]